MNGVKRVWVLLAVLAAMNGCMQTAMAQVATTAVQDTVYTATGAPASGTVEVTWGGFTAADGTAVPAGSTSVTLGAGGALSLALAPNAGATPMGSYYTAVFHLGDGTVSRQYWVVPVAAPGGGPVRLAAIQNQVLPLSVAMQTVSKQYVDGAIAAAAAAGANGAIGAARLPAFGPDGDLAGSYTDPAVVAVHATTGTMDGVVVGAAVPAAGNFTTGGFTGTVNLAAVGPGVTFYLDNSPFPGRTTFVTATDAGLTNGIAAGDTCYLTNRYSGSAAYPYFGAAVCNDNGILSFFVSSPGALGSQSYTHLLDINDESSALDLKGTLSVANAVNGTFAGTLTAAQYVGPTSAPTGPCGTNGAWVLSQDGHATVCAGGVWVTKI